jgi:Lon protease-like protein
MNPHRFDGMSERLPLFPLGTVLYPGLLLPLHIFEERYRRLVRDLLDGPEPRRFGVIAIRKGRETGVDSVSALYEVGCTATVRRVVPHEDGRYELVTAGTQRFRLAGLDDSLPYLRGEVEYLDEPTGDEAAAAQAARAVQAAFGDYLAALSERGAQVRVPDLPDEPVLLSYLVAATIVVDLPDRQGLLAEPDAMGRLEAERTLLTRETAMLRTFTSTPAPDLRNTPFNPN